ncbi:eukaryotic translation initiation factor 5B-like [Humulus lupulus]|uniref:eukaryotic translation initiation factor 5B-like n=1 Tax=Humulus lupulus TaxID=3486 RepID=UPI002B402589|nr:eukaryotic translation initiation factor 5B-like [Humulus lupulus]
MDFSLLDTLPIPYHLFDKDDNFNFPTNSFSLDFFEADSDCSCSSLDNVATIMQTNVAFDIYASRGKSASSKKSSRKNAGDASGEPLSKKARPADTPIPTPSRITTPPPPPCTGSSTKQVGGSLKHAEEIKAWETKVEALEAKVKAAEENAAALIEELKKSKEDLAKAVAAKDKYKEASETNYKEAVKLQEDQVASMKEVSRLEDQVKLLEEQDANELERCAARLEEEKNAPESPEISLATGINEVKEEARTTLDVVLAAVGSLGLMDLEDIGGALIVGFEEDEDLMADMESEYVFDIYSALEALEAPSSKKKTSKRHPRESSKMPQAKKARTVGPPADGPSANATPPNSPLEQQTPPAPAGSTPSPPAPTTKLSRLVLLPQGATYRVAP